ncbi:MAG: hypothetical protein GXY05_15295 [Clostridiales bacterium]|nr:hypothetical protein [Clostridiales bacterium]
MKKFFTIALALALTLSLTACGGNENSNADSNSPPVTPKSENSGTAPTSSPGNSENGNIPAGAEEIGQGIYYYELYELSGDSGGGATPREGADLVVSDVLTRTDFFDLVGSDRCVYISLDDLLFLDSAMGHGCYIYSIAVGTIEGGLMGDDYQVVYRAAVDYSEWSAAIYDDFSGGMGDIIGGDDGRGDTFDDIGDGEIYTDAPYWDGEYIDRDAGFSITVTNYNDVSFFDFEIYLLRNGSDVLEGKATISSDTDYTAEYGELSFILYGDNSAIELFAPEGSEWAHLSGNYERIE